jgi:hypothetical protein
MATAKKGTSKTKSATVKGGDGAASVPRRPTPAAPEGAEQVPIEGFSDNIRMAAAGNSLFAIAGGIAVIALVGAAILGSMEGDGFRRFLHSYLTAFMAALAIGLGTLWWVTLQNLVNSHWSIVVRRVGELYAQAPAVLGILSLPIVIPTVMGNDVLYEWANHAKVEADHLLHHKAGYLNPTFFLIRMVFYFVFFAFLGGYFLKSSLKQDQTANASIVGRMRVAAGPGMIVLALALTFCAIDLLMSLNARWFSTIFGVYYFASCVLSAHAVLALSMMWLQKNGKLKTSVTVDHYHDLGKMLFAFTVFWAYIGFAQFMLIWYANIPEETEWFKERFFGGWGGVAWVLLFGHFVLPFFGLLSRHIKRNKTTLGFWAVWVLVMVYLDMYWLVMPAVDHHGPPFALVDILCWVGLVSAVVATAAFGARNVNLIPVKDPRLERSLAFENI